MLSNTLMRTTFRLWKDGYKHHYSRYNFGDLAGDIGGVFDFFFLIFAVLINPFSRHYYFMTVHSKVTREVKDENEGFLNDAQNSNKSVLGRNLSKSTLIRINHQDDVGSDVEISKSGDDLSLNDNDVDLKKLRQDIRN